jgi:hypothetical protein
VFAGHDDEWLVAAFHYSNVFPRDEPDRLTPDSDYQLRR